MSRRAAVAVARRAVLAAPLLLAACGTPPRAPEPLDPFWAASFRSETFHGSPLSGPVLPPDEPPDPDEFLSVAVEVHHVPTRPRDAMQPLSRVAGIAAQDTGGEGFLPTLTLPSDARIGFGEEAADFVARLREGAWGRATHLADGSTALAAGMTFCLLAAPSPTPPVVPAHGGLAPGPQTGEIELHRPAAVDGVAPPLQLALVHPVAVVTLERLTPATARDAARLLVELPPGDVQHADVAIVISAGEASRLGGAFVFTFAVRPAPADAGAQHRAAVEAALSSARDAAASLAGMLVLPDDVETFVLETAVARISRPVARRAALLFLAHELGAPLAADLALHGDHELLVELAAGVRGVLDRRAEIGRSDLGWILEKEAWELVEAHRDDDVRTLLLEALLTIHSGEVGRVGGRVLDLADSAQSLGEFAEAVVRENLDHLRDRDPAARVRAFDWLAAREAAPPGFDPLGPTPEREAALDEALARTASEEEERFR